MVSTFAFNPMLLIHVSAILQTIFLAFLIIFPEMFSPEDKTWKWGFRIFQGVGLGALVVFGLLFVDTALLWLFGNWSMADWRFQLPSVIILLYLGLAYTIVPLFRRGHWLDIIFCGAAVTTILVFLHWWVPSHPVMEHYMKTGLPIIVGVLIGAYVVVFLLKKPNKPKKEGMDQETNYFWDIQKPLHHVFNLKIHFIFWLLAVVQSMLAFNGYSILTIWAS